MFIVNAQALILKNYSLPTFEKTASMLTGTTDVVLLWCWESPPKVRKGGLGALLWRRSVPFFGVCNPFLSWWPPTMCVLAYFNLLFISRDSIGITEVVLAAITRCLGYFGS